MEPKVTIQITWSNGETYPFDVHAMVIANGQVCLIGYNNQPAYNQLTALGIKEEEVGKSNGEHHVYFVKQQDQKEYLNIINAPVGKTIELLSEMVHGFWSELIFTKVELTSERIGKLKYFEVYHIVTKIGDGEFLKHNHGGFHQKAVLIDYKI